MSPAPAAHAKGHAPEEGCGYAHAGGACSDQFGCVDAGSRRDEERDGNERRQHEEHSGAAGYSGWLGGGRGGQGGGGVVKEGDACRNGVRVMRKVLPEHAGSLENAVAEKQEVGVPGVWGGGGGGSIEGGRGAHHEAAAAYRMLDRRRARMPGY
jgi:hypothetical protein